MTTKYQIAVPVSLYAWVETDSPEDMDEDTVWDALVTQYGGKYAEVDMKTAGLDGYQVVDQMDDD